MDQFAEVLFSLNKHCFALLGVWLKEALQPPGFPSSRVTTEQKNNFSQQILRYRYQAGDSNVYFFHALNENVYNSVLQRASEQEQSEGNSEGVHTAVQRAPWYRVRRRVLRLWDPHQPKPRHQTAGWSNNNILTFQHQ